MILIIDDNFGKVYNILTKYLDNFDAAYQSHNLLHITGSTLDAEEYLDKYKFNFVCVDYELKPGMGDGWHILRKLVAIKYQGTVILTTFNPGVMREMMSFCREHELKFEVSR